MSALRAAAFIARRDLTYLLRQRETLLWTFVMPIIFFYFIGTVTGGMGGPSADRPDLLALAAPKGSGFLVDELVSRLEGQGFAVHRADSEEDFQGYGRRLRIPEPTDGGDGFTEAVLAGTPVQLQFGRSGEGPGVQYDRVRVSRAVYGLLADLVVIRAEQAGYGPDTAGASGGEEGRPGSAPPTGRRTGDAETAPGSSAGSGPTAADFARLAAVPRSLTLAVRPAGDRLLVAARRLHPLTLAVRPAGERVEPPGGYEQTIPGTTVMFTMLIMLSSGSILLVIERRRGLLRRLAATPISRGAIVGGKLGARMGLAVIQIGFGMATGTLLFGMDWGESLWMIALVLAAWALFTAGLGMILGNLARTEGQVMGLGIVATMVLAALGGCWWPVEITPEWMQTLALTLPTGWTMDAMHELVSFGHAPATVLPHLTALLAGALVLAWVGARTFRYQ